MSVMSVGVDMRRTRVHFLASLLLECMKTDWAGHRYESHLYFVRLYFATCSLHAGAVGGPERDCAEETGIAPHQTTRWEYVGRETAQSHAIETHLETVHHHGEAAGEGVGAAVECRASSLGMQQRGHPKEIAGLAADTEVFASVATLTSASVGRVQRSSCPSC